MQAEIITIGTELLLGQVLDTNSNWIGRRLAEVGIDLYRKQSVGDNQKRLVSSIQTVLADAELLITTGGLGPTQDDITREAIADALNLELVKDQACLAEIKSYFKARGRKLAESNYKQAYLPQGAKVVENKLGTAPGFIVENNNKIIIALPGVPSEMKEMMKQVVIPYLLTDKIETEEVIKSKVIKTCGIGESDLESKIGDILRKQSNPTIALLASGGEVKIRVTAKAKDQVSAKQMIKREIDKLKTRISDYIYGYDEMELEDAVAELLWEKDLKLAVAESCTGGLLANRLTDVSGSSAYFERGVISYSNRAKVELLNVKEQTLKEYGAVSAQTAKEMAEGIKRLAGSDLAIAVTGIAGPTGGTAKKPVGLVHLAIIVGDRVKSFSYNFNGDRKRVKYLTTQFALSNLRKELLA